MPKTAQKIPNSAILIGHTQNTCRVSLLIVANVNGSYATQVTGGLLRGANTDGDGRIRRTTQLFESGRDPNQVSGASASEKSVHGPVNEHLAKIRCAGFDLDSLQRMPFGRGASRATPQGWLHRGDAQMN